VFDFPKRGAANRRNRPTLTATPGGQLSARILRQPAQSPRKPARVSWSSIRLYALACAPLAVVIYEAAHVLTNGRVMLAAGVLA
jgi:hypothetical protein